MGESRITPSGIINDAVSMIGKMNDSSFPIDVFPNKIRNIILNMYEYLAFPIDYTACSMMTAISTCIGNTHILHFKTGWDIKCIIYMALVGRPGANKSHPLKTAFEPLFRFDKEQKEIYNEEYRKYESIYNPQIQISAESETKRSIFREKDKTKRSKKESAQHSKSRNKSFVMTSVSAL